MAILTSMRVGVTMDKKVKSILKSKLKEQGRFNTTLHLDPNAVDIYTRTVMIDDIGKLVAVEDIPRIKPKYVSLVRTPVVGLWVLYIDGIYKPKAKVSDIMMTTRRSRRKIFRPLNIAV